MSKEIEIEFKTLLTKEEYVNLRLNAKSISLN